MNCVHPGVTRTERTPRLLAARAAELGITPEEVERRDFAHDSPRGNAIGRMVDADEIAYVTAFLASDKAWAVSGELVAVPRPQQVHAGRLAVAPGDGGLRHPPSGAAPPLAPDLRRGLLKKAPSAEVRRPRGAASFNRCGRR